MRGPKAVINPEVLKWLRTSSGFSTEDAARRADTTRDKYEAWENVEDRSKQPSMAQLRKLARAFKRSISDFYLPKPSQEPPIPHDFRRLPDDGVHSYSPALRHEVRLAYRRRAIALDLASELDIRGIRFESLGTVNLNDNPEGVGARIRKLLGVDTAEQKQWRDPRSGYNAWRRKMESLYVLVLQVTTVEKSQMLGFSLAYDELPVIAVNRKLRPNGRTFTLLHEFAHLMLGERGLCDLQEDALRSPREQAVEIFANHVAGAALVPTDALLSHELARIRPDRTDDWSEHDLAVLARDFCVSEEVVLRRLLMAGRVSQEFYANKRRQYLALWEKLDKKQKEKSDDDFRRNMALEAASNLGTFARLVLGSYYADTINLADASKLLGVKAQKVPAVGEYLR